MIARKSGHIVGICSLAAMRGLLHATSYSASKATQMSFLESLRLELSMMAFLSQHYFPVSFKHKWPTTMLSPHAFTITVERCVDISLRSIAKQKRQVLFPFPMNILALLNRMLPVFYMIPS